MPLEPGTTVGVYEVVAKIGEGGMGEVYRARDAKLQRDVALKVLPEAFTEDPDRLARFEREARVLASLSHPNIGAIHGFEDSGGLRALVLELIEGPTLAERIAQGPLPVDDALGIARQIGDALEAAHEQGVVHRDLKPANVKVAPDGTVKVLDFGLAKAMAPESGDASASLSPTVSLTAAATQTGMVIGTAAYMAPEQAKGLPVDKRADIWAFGAVLFEMLSGKRLFEAGDVSEMLASVLVKDPDISSVGGEVPPRVRAVLRRCLVKDPKDRLRDIGDVRLALEGAFETEASGLARATKAVTSGVWQRPVPVALSGLALLLGGAGVGLWLSGTDHVAPRVERFRIGPTSEAMVVSISYRDLAVTPSGDAVVYVASESGGASYLSVRAVDALSPRRLEGAGDRTLSPFTSPDGAWAGFYAAGDQALRRVSIFDGPSVEVARLEDGPPAGVDWFEDDTIIFGTVRAGGLRRVASSGGEPEEISTPDGQERHAFPDVLPGGAAVLFTIQSTRGGVETPEIAILDLESGAHRALGPSGTMPRYVPSGHIVYGAGGTLRAVRFDLGRLEVTDQSPIPVLDRVTTKGSGAVNFDLAEDGTLVYTTGGGADGARQLVWADRAGREQPLEMPAALFQRPRISPNGSRVAVDIAGPENTDLWIHDLTRGTEAPLTTDAADDRAPLWTPDGTRLVFESNRAGNAGLYLMDPGRPGAPEPLLSTDDQRTIEPSGFSPDGQTLAFWWTPRNNPDIGLLSMGSGEATMLMEDGDAEAGAVISPDGGWFAYEATVTGRSEVYVERFPGRGDRVTISTAGGGHPLWSRDGQELFYRTDDGVMAVPVDAGESFDAGTPELLFEGDYYFDRSRRTWDVHPDGQRFLMVKSVSRDGGQEDVELVLVQNWLSELERLVPGP